MLYVRSHRNLLFPASPVATVLAKYLATCRQHKQLNHTHWCLTTRVHTLILMGQLGSYGCSINGRVHNCLCCWYNITMGILRTYMQYLIPRPQRALL